MAETKVTKRISGYCALCWSSCGCISVTEDGRLTAVEPDPTHPTGQALCAKGRATPEYVYSSARMLYPMKRTRPKGEPDPGWQRISWDEALDTTAEKLKAIQQKSGTESIAFSITTSAGTAMQDGSPFVERLRQAFGTPNAVESMELCGFASIFVYQHTFGVSMPVSEVEKSDCIILWGHNPTTTWLPFGSRITQAKRRGAKLIVMDPVRVGLAAKADEWLRVRPGTDGALALSLAHVMIEEALYDEAFVRDWTNGPFLIRDDDGEFLSAADLTAGGDPKLRVVWDALSDQTILYDPDTGEYGRDGVEPALSGHHSVAGLNGTIGCRSVFDCYAALCAQYPQIPRCRGRITARVRDAEPQGRTLFRNIPSTRLPALA